MLSLWCCCRYDRADVEGLLAIYTRALDIATNSEMLLQTLNGCLEQARLSALPTRTSRPQPPRHPGGSPDRATCADG